MDEMERKMVGLHYDTEGCFIYSDEGAVPVKVTKFQLTVVQEVTFLGVLEKSTEERIAINLKDIEDGTWEQRLDEQDEEADCQFEDLWNELGQTLQELHNNGWYLTPEAEWHEDDEKDEATYFGYIVEFETADGRQMYTEEDCLDWSDCDELERMMNSIAQQYK